MENKQDDNNNQSLLIDKMMQKFNYYPNITNFESINKEIPDKNNFTKVFKNFFLKLKEFDSKVTENFSSKNYKENWNYSFTYDFDDYLTNYMKDNDIEVREYIKKYWQEQIDNFNNNILHIYYFIILVYKYTNSCDKFSDYDKNILYWTILYHDLGKYIDMNPIIKEKIDVSEFDKTHPFKGIIIFLNSAFEHDLFFYPNDEYKNELNNIYKNQFVNAIFSSWNLENIYYGKRFNISFNNIDIIEKFFMKIKSEEKNQWIYDICILITFHQSLPNNEYRMNSPLLEDKYIKIFFDKRLAEMMRVIMIYDSCSHSMFFGSNWPELINKNMDKVMKLFE